VGKESEFREVGMEYSSVLHLVIAATRSSVDRDRARCAAAKILNEISRYCTSTRENWSPNGKVHSKSPLSINKIDPDRTLLGAFSRGPTR